MSETTTTTTTEPPSLPVSECFIFYDSYTGAIRQIGAVPWGYGLYQISPPGMSLLVLEEIPDDFESFVTDKYVNMIDSTVATRQTMAPEADKDTITADGVDAVTISELPIPCVVSVEGVLTAGPITVDDGVIAITSDFVGTFTVTVTSEPTWFPWSRSFDAT